MIPWSALLPAAGRLLSGWQGYAAAAAVAAAVAAGAAWTVQGWRLVAELERTRAEHAAAIARATERRIEHDAAVHQASARLAELAQGVIDDLQQAQARIDRDRAALRDDARRLRDAFAASAAAGRAGGAADPGPAAAADVVRADVLGGVAGRAADLAAAVDEQHAYGRAVAARYRQVAEELRVLREKVRAH